MLRHGRSGIVFVPEMQELGFKCCLYGPVKQPDTSCIHKKSLHTMATMAKCATVADLEAGVIRFALLMMANNFVAPTANLDNISQEYAGIRHVQKRQDAFLNTAMTFNSGLGGMNACRILRKK